MRNSSILKWAQKNNSKNNAASSGGGGGGGAPDGKKWLHPNETLTQNHVAYLVKFLGNTEVDRPKGIDVVKQGIQKLKFNQQLKKSEAGTNAGKTPKVELTISVDGVAIQEPKTKKMLHQYPLHKISYCADDKAEKRFFSFIAKEDDGKHTCFVFVSDKLAEEITLTIGQAFELAYKKFLDTSGKDLEARKRQLAMSKRIEILEAENAELKRRLRDVAAIKGHADVHEYMTKNDIADLCEIARVPGSSSSSAAPAAAPAAPPASSSPSVSAAAPHKVVTSTPDPAAGKKKSDAAELISLDATSGKLDNFSLDDINDDDFDPRKKSDTSSSSEDEDELDDGVFNPRSAEDDAHQLRLPPTPAPSLPPPTLPPRDKMITSHSAGHLVGNNNNSGSGLDIFGSNPFNNSSSNPFGDPFGMSAFDSSAGSGKPASPAALAVAPPAKSSSPAPAVTFSLDELDPLKK